MLKWRQRLDEARLAVGFLTRLPVAAPTDLERTVLAQAVWAFPLAGFLIASLAAAVFGAADWLGLSPWLCGTLAILSQILLTGGLHEDGLADGADGFGGRDRAQRLAIMRDSRIGSYGVLALASSLMLRVGALSALAEPAAVSIALLVAAMVSRAGMCLPMRYLPTARVDGLSVFAGRPNAMETGIAAAMAVLFSFVALDFGLAALVLVGGLVGVVAVSIVARRGLGGQTGDVLGAVQQVTECICLLLLSTQF